LPLQLEPSFRRKPESRVPGENRDPVFEMVPDFRRDDVWMPPYQVRGKLLKSGMTEKAIYGQTLIRFFALLRMTECRLIDFLRDHHY
jgi:hypothetical protein